MGRTFENARPIRLGGGTNQTSQPKDSTNEEKVRQEYMDMFVKEHKRMPTNNAELKTYIEESMLDNAMTTSKLVTVPVEFKLVWCDAERRLKEVGETCGGLTNMAMLRAAKAAKNEDERVRGILEKDPTALEIMQGKVNDSDYIDVDAKPDVSKLNDSEQQALRVLQEKDAKIKAVGNPERAEQRTDLERAMEGIAPRMAAPKPMTQTSVNILEADESPPEEEFSSDED